MALRPEEARAGAVPEAEDTWTERWRCGLQRRGARRLQGRPGVSPLVSLSSDPPVYAGDSQWWEPDVKFIRGRPMGWTAGGEGCRVRLQGPGKLASHLQAHTACTQPTFSPDSCYHPRVFSLQGGFSPHPWGTSLLGGSFSCLYSLFHSHPLEFRQDGNLPSKALP